VAKTRGYIIITFKVFILTVVTYEDAINFILY